MPQALLNLPLPLILVLAALILAGEPAFLAGVVLPSVSTALGLGFLASAGAIPLPVALATATLAVLGGDMLGYSCGRFSLRRRANQKGAGPASAVPTARWRRIGLSPARHARVAEFVARHGGRSIFLARWVVGARTLVPRLVAAGGTSLAGFLRWSIPAGLAWSATYVFAGYLAGDAYQRVSAVAGHASLALIALSVAAVGALAAGRWLGRLGRDATLSGRSARSAFSATLAGPAALIAILTGLAAVLSVAVVVSVRTSGLPALDGRVATALASQPTNQPAQYLLQFTPGTALILVAALLALWRPITSSRHRSGPLGILALAGGALPLLILTVVLHGVESVAGRDHLFAIQSAMLTTAIVMSAWTLARKRTTRAAQYAIWTLGVAIVLAVTAARLYVGWGTLSSTVSATLIGALWAGVFAAAWTARPGQSSIARSGRSSLAHPARSSWDSGRSSARTEEAPPPEDGYRVAPVHHAVVEVGERLNLVAAVAGNARLVTSSAVQFEHFNILLALPSARSSFPAVLPFRSGFVRR